jgi:hypothetical protein
MKSGTYRAKRSVGDPQDHDPNEQAFSMAGTGAEGCVLVQTVLVRVDWVLEPELDEEAQWSGCMSQ